MADITYSAAISVTPHPVGICPTAVNLNPSRLENSAKYDMMVETMI